MHNLDASSLQLAVHSKIGAGYSEQPLPARNLSCFSGRGRDRPNLKLATESSPALCHRRVRLRHSDGGNLFRFPTAAEADSRPHDWLSGVSEKPSLKEDLLRFAQSRWPRSFANLGHRAYTLNSSTLAGGRTSSNEQRRPRAHPMRAHRIGAHKSPGLVPLGLGTLSI